MIYHRRPDWRIKESAVTPEAVFLNRRAFLGGAAGAAALSGLGLQTAQGATPPPAFEPRPALNPAYA
ncbi:MAG: twin-arginine translocation signal domain-containing protein, partial [Pseudomonadota bacterium]